MTVSGIFRIINLQQLLYILVGRVDQLVHPAEHRCRSHLFLRLLIQIPLIFYTLFGFLHPI